MIENISKSKKNNVITKENVVKPKNDVSKSNSQASNNNISKPVVAAVTLDIACKSILH